MLIRWKKQASNDAFVYLCFMQLILNDIGTGEIILILLFILMFFGAKSIPGIARTFGRTIRQVKDASSEIQNEIRKSGNEIKGDLNLKSLIDDTVQDVKRPLDQYASDLDDAVKYEAPRRPAVAKPPGHVDRVEKVETTETKVEVPDSRSDAPNPKPEATPESPTTNEAEQTEKE